MPVSYVSTAVGIPLQLLSDLLEGQEIALQKRHLSEKYPLYLPKTLIAKVQKHFATSKEPYPFKLSKACASYNVKKLDALEELDGSGFWSKFKRFWKKVGKGIVKGAKAVAPILKAVAPVAINLVPGAKEVVEAGREIGKQAGVGEQVDAGLNQVLGVGMKAPRKRRPAMKVSEF